MAKLDVTFDTAPWEQYLYSRQMGDAVSAAQLLHGVQNNSTVNYSLKTHCDDANCEFQDICFIAKEHCVKKVFCDLLDSLTPRESETVRLFYGIGCEPHTKEQIAIIIFGECTDFYLTRIRQIRAKALRKLRHPRRCKLLKNSWLEVILFGYPKETCYSKLYRNIFGYTKSYSNTLLYEALVNLKNTAFKNNVDNKQTENEKDFLVLSEYYGFIAYECSGESLKDKVMTIPVEELDFSEEIVMCLKRFDINTVGDLASFTRENLISIPNINITDVIEIEKQLGDLGIQIESKKV